MLQTELNAAAQQPEATSAPKEPLIRPRQRHPALGFDLRYLCFRRRRENMLDLCAATLCERTIELREVLLKPLRHGISEASKRVAQLWNGQDI